MHDKIIYRRNHFGIYDLKSMGVLEGVYAYNYSKITGISPEKAFLLKNGRRPEEMETEYLDRLFSGEYAPYDSYWHNWSYYSAQNVMLEHPIFVPSFGEISRIGELTFGHSLEEDRVHGICKIIRSGSFNLKESYYGVNTWQILQTAMTINKLNAKHDRAISLLFNKIYKRDPLEYEISLCKRINLDASSKEIRDEIESTVQVEHTWYLRKFKDD